MIRSIRFPSSQIVIIIIRKRRRLRGVAFERPRKKNKTVCVCTCVTSWWLWKFVQPCWTEGRKKRLFFLLLLLLPLEEIEREGVLWLESPGATKTWRGPRRKHFPPGWPPHIQIRCTFFSLSSSSSSPSSFFFNVFFFPLTQLGR